MNMDREIKEEETEEEEEEEEYDDFEPDGYLDMPDIKTEPLEDISIKEEEADEFMEEDSGEESEDGSGEQDANTSSSTAGGFKSLVVQGKNGGDPIHVCLHCGKSFMRDSSLKDHQVKSHSDEISSAGRPPKKPTRVTADEDTTCKLCHKTYKDKKTLYIHMRHHVEERKHKCEQCGKAYLFLSQLKNHLISHRANKDKPFKCSYCTRGFTDRRVLEDHERLHTGEAPFPCDICGKRFRQKANRRVHMAMHVEQTEDRPFRCDQCGCSFAQQQHLNTHLRGHKNKVFHCQFCSTTFTAKSSLAVHIKTHKFTKDQFKCRVCLTVFPTHAELTAHMPQHGITTKYPCHECGLDTFSTTDFNRHIKSHDGVFYYLCPDCGQPFRQPRRLESHMWKKHSHANGLAKALYNVHYTLPNADYIINKQGKIAPNTKTNIVMNNLATNHQQEVLISDDEDEEDNKASNSNTNKQRAHHGDYDTLEQKSQEDQKETIDLYDEDTDNEDQDDGEETEVSDVKSLTDPDDIKAYVQREVMKILQKSQ